MTYWAVVMALSLPLAALNAVPAAPQAAPGLLIRAAHLLDVKTGQVLRDQAILIDGVRVT